MYERNSFRISKTTCFGVVKIVFNLQRNGTFSTKTNCFGIMIIYDAFTKNTYKNYGSICEIKIVKTELK